MHDGETADRAAAEDQQREAGNQRRHIGIENRVPGTLVTGLDRRVRRVTPPQLFSDAFIDQHIGVDRHTECQCDGRDARQRQCCLQHRQDRDEQQQVDRERYRGDQPHQ